MPRKSSHQKLKSKNKSRARLHRVNNRREVRSGECLLFVLVHSFPYVLISTR